MPLDFASSVSEAEVLLAEFRQDPTAMAALSKAEAALVEVVKTRGKVLACGNGGSLADAMHFAEEFSGRFRKDRPPYPAIALSDPTHMSCVANDYGFEHVFERQVDALGQEGDVLLVLSTSGNSANLLLALDKAKERRMTSIAFLGKGGGTAASKADIKIMAPGETSDRIQEIHMLCLHLLVQAVEEALGHD